LGKEKKGRGEFRTVSLPSSLVERVEKTVNDLRYWPTKTDFVREAVLEKLERFGQIQKKLEEEEKPELQ
jgi:Arc/MetJ-type ribon-helix-helix transcriptional regulator